MKRYGFGYRERLHRGVDFKAVFACRARRRCGPFALYFKPLSQASDYGVGVARLGIVVNRLQGNASVRTAAKRLIRETFRLNKECLAPGDYVVHIYKNLMKVSRAAQHAYLRELFEIF